MFEDKRSKKVILLAHCILNQNAKLDRCAHYPGAIKEVVDVLVERGIGIIQAPCPELLYLGLDRQTDNNASPTIEAEDTRIAGRMVEENGTACCRDIVNQLVYQIGEYRKHGFEIIGMIGINGSPTCGVETTWVDDHEKQSPGVFIQILQETLDQQGITLPMHGIKAYEPQNAVTVVKDMVG